MDVYAAIAALAAVDAASARAIPPTVVSFVLWRNNGIIPDTLTDLVDGD